MSQKRRGIGIGIGACVLGGLVWSAHAGWSAPPVSEPERYRDDFGLSPSAASGPLTHDYARSELRPPGPDSTSLGSPVSPAQAGPALSPHPPERTGGRVTKPGPSVGSKSRTPATSGWTATLGWLAGMVALILGAATLLRKHVPGLSGYLPAEALQVLGKRPLTARHTLHLVRLGSRILVIGSSPQGLNTLGEIRDPVEIDFIAGACREAQPNSVVQSFSQLLRNYHEDKTEQDDRTTSDPVDNRDRSRSRPDSSPDSHLDEADDAQFPLPTRDDAARPTTSDLAAVRLKDRLSLGAGLPSDMAREQGSLGGSHYA